MPVKVKDIKHSNMEIWKDIPGFNGWYQASNKGRIRSWRKKARGRGRRDNPYYLTITTYAKGYQFVMLRKKGKKLKRKTSRLVAKTFIPNPNNKPEVNHKNGIKSDNSVDNLEWCTRSENVRHSVKNNLHWVPKGSNHPSSKLTEIDVIDIRNTYRLGCFTHKEIAEAWGVHRRHITGIINRRFWAHV